jgi:hypothetical protein
MTTAPHKQAPLHPATIRLARAVVASAKRDGDVVEPHVAEIARLPLPEDSFKGRSA